MRLEKSVFGYTKFKVIDNLLFQNVNNNLVDTLSQYVEMSLPDSMPINNPSSLFGIPCLPMCETVWCKQGSSISSWLPGCHYEYCVYDCFEPIPTPNPQVPIYPGSGGGTHGGGGGGTAPIPTPQPPATPCDSLILDLQSDPVFAQKFKDLGTPSNFALDHEKGFLINNRATHSYTDKEGSSTSPTITWDFFVGDKIDGKLHDHITGYNSVPSMNDLVSMAEVYLNGVVRDTMNYFEGMISSYGVPYIVKITNPIKFRQWATKILAMNRVKLQNYVDDNNLKISYIDNWALNEINLLKILDKELKGSIKLYSGNADCN